MISRNILVFKIIFLIIGRYAKISNFIVTQSDYFSILWYNEWNYLNKTLKKMNIDPAIASSVFVTTITDVIGFVSFLGVGAYFL